MLRIVPVKAERTAIVLRKPVYLRQGSQFVCLCRALSEFGSILNIQSICQVGGTDQDAILADIIASMACCVYF